jgi:predicted amidohydrolase YtcJ
MRTLIALSFVALACVGCRTVPSEGKGGGEALLLTGGRIRTGDPGRPLAEALAAADGKVLAVGSRAEVTAALEKAGKKPSRTVELAGRWVVPGFVDAHIHVLSGGLSFDRLDLAGKKTKAEILAAVAQYARSHPDKTWILGRGWSYQAFRPGLPGRADLDQVVPDRPVYLRSYDGHTAWANTRALDLAGVKGSSGALVEGAMESVSKVIPRPSRAEKRQAIVRALEHAVRHGVTTVCEVGGPLADLEIYAELDGEGRLPARVVYGPSIDDGIDAYAQARQALLARRTPSSHLYPGPLKDLVDGVVESNTAALLGPYGDGTRQAEPAHLTPERIRAQLERADALGLDVAYHAIGDGAVRMVLDELERTAPTSARPARRHRLEHIEVIAPEDVQRFAQIGAVASMMPIHAEPGDEPNGGVWATKVGSSRLPRAFAIGDLWRARAPLAFGSDWPVAPLGPLPALAVAVTRQGPDGKPAGGWIPAQRMPLDAALDAYTSGSAHAVRLEEEVGRLRPGLAADLVVLAPSADLERPQTLFQGEVDLTVVAGRVAYARQP